MIAAMLNILFWCPVLAAVQTLTIDSQLGTSIEDCFERVSIGEQLPPDAIYRNISELTTRECEQLCKQDKQCQIFDYGVGAKGNATCNLSTLNAQDLREKNLLNRHPDYDIYVRRFNCEQPPPTPLQPQFDEENPPAHRPVFRPDEDEAKNPLADDFLTDLRPFETRPGFRPTRPYGNHIDSDRPDDYNNNKPDFDRPPSYGDHRPPEIPYRPIRPLRPVDPFRPDRPNDPYMPEPLDPYRPGPLRPDPYRPERPIRPDIPYGPERPLRPEDYRPMRPNTPYGSPLPQHPYKPDRPLRPDPYEPETLGGPYRPERPGGPYRPGDPYRPDRPSDFTPGYPNKPYNQSHSKPDPYDQLQFDGGYGRPPRPDPGLWRPDPIYPASPNDDVPDIYGPKPIRPQRPDRPPYTPQEPEYHYVVRPNKKPTTQRPVNDYNKPTEDPYKPDYEPNRPDPYLPDKNPIPESGYGNKPAQNYPDKPNNNQYKPKPEPYGPESGPVGPPDRPYRPSRPYPSRPYEKPSYSYNSQYASSYGQNQDNSIYLEIFDPPRPYKPMRPLKDRPSYSSQGYGQNYGYGQGSYDYGHHSYAPAPNTHLGYGPVEMGLYGQNYNRPAEDERPDRPHYGEASYGGSQTSQNFDYSSSSYGNQKPQEYKPSYGSNQGSYGHHDYTSSQNYGSNRPNGNDKPSYSTNQDKPSYGSPKPPSYGSNHDSSYGSTPKPSYGNSQEKPFYGTQKPNYGSSQDKPSYEAQNPSYGAQYGNQDPNRPDGPSYGQDSYGSQESYPGQKPNETYRPDLKPVYEYELQKPGNVPSYIVKPNGDVVTSRPVTVSDYGRPDSPHEKPEKPYGSDPGYGGTGYGDRPGYDGGKPGYGTDYERPGYGGGGQGYGGAGYREKGKLGSYKACFRRVLAGQRALRSHVRRVVHCERLEDCRRECAEERRFHCESFNYRLDPSFRGKGLCELMTKPIEAFDIQRDFVDDKDYDFYEIDRNSLEPNCPESLRGPGLLHSGYLSSKPSMPAASWSAQWDRLDFHGPRGQDRYYERPRKPNRRYEDQFYIPYQIGIGRSNDDQAWGQYGGVYGGDTYYKNRIDHHKSINYWRLSSDLDQHGVRPWGYKTDFNYNDLRRDGDDEIHPYSYGSWKRGRWNNSGTSGPGTWSGLEYGESNFYKPLHHYGTAEYKRKGQECTSERRPGMSLSTGSIRRSLLARNVLECEAACFEEREFKCVSYSYRYSNSHGSDNCFLSERPYRGLELSTDSGSDVYAMPQDCTVSISHKPWVESECFWHVRSGVAVSESAARTAITVAGLGACEAECIRAQGFFCRVFSFRFVDATIGEDLPNCILSAAPPTSLSAGGGLRPSKGHELYARGNYGRGCEPAVFDNIVVSEPKKECYLQYDNAAKLIGAAIKGHARVRDEQSCGVACTDAPFRCLSFSFNNNAPPGTDNCLLSEIRLFDLQKGVDYEHSADDWLFAFDLFNGQCWRKIHGKHSDDHAPELPRPFVPYEDPHYSPDRPDSPSGPGYLPAPEVYISGPSGPPSAPSGPPSGPPAPPHAAAPGFRPSYPDTFRPSYPPYKPSSEPSYPSYKPYEPYLPSGPTGTGYPGYEKPGYTPVDPGSGYRPEGRPARPVERPYPGEREEGPIAVSWSKYTVSGFPCRAGTTCAQNQVAGHWACEPEGGEVGSWDYCCAPSHRCGYSEGFSKPWCYVGPENDQWRPCSEKYYPYHQHNVPHPSQGHTEPPSRVPGRPWSRPASGPGYLPDRDKPVLSPYISEADRKYWDDLYKDGPKAYYDQYGNPLPGYSRVPPISRPHIKYQHRYPRPGAGHWAPLALEAPPELDPPVPGGLGVPRYWPVAYLHKGPPPNITYFKFNETAPATTENHDYHPERPERPDRFRPGKPERPNKPDAIDRVDRPDLPRPKPGEFVKVHTEKPKNNDLDIKSHRDEKTRNISNITDDIKDEIEKAKTTTPKVEVKSKEEPKEEVAKEVQLNVSDVEIVKPVVVSKNDKIKGIDDKLEDLTESIEVLDIEDAKKGEKESDLKTLEAEEKQIEAIGRLLASRRGGQLILEKRSQKDLESKSIAVDKDLMDFNFGNRFPTTERRGIIQKVTKDDIEREKNDRSLEVSETTFVRPPRVLSTTENIRKAIVNGKVFYDATIREQRDIYNNSTRKPRTFRHLEDSRAPSVISNTNYGKKKVIKARNVNPVRRVRRVYRKRYNPEEVRRRLLERERSLKEAKDTARV